ncbi:16S rRNA (cytosine(967)-C(5))-methyltransferase RsmB [Sporolactobacillus sp. THM7-7]|nr:16S rRNA (cytosine(967)-C(5))-methyltransferase RsmB [Sporolactobacillus sp. THM7-7]
MSRESAREVAFKLLLKIKRDHAYSQLALNDALSESALPRRDKNLVTVLVYGTLQRELTLDTVLSSFVREEKKLDDWVRVLLLLSFYQKLYLNRIPDHAIVNEAVSIAKKRGHRGIVGFVNGVLRQFLRRGVPDFSAIEPVGRRLAVQYSHPEWLLDLWEKQWDRQTALRVAEAGNQVPRLFLRVNRTKIDRAQLSERLTREGARTENSPLSPDGLIVKDGLAGTAAAYRKGLLTIQDESSMLVADAVSPSPGMQVLDTCAGPGGKTTHLAERMANKGTVIALDLHQHKTRLIDDAACRLGLTNIETKVMDARKAGSAFPEAHFDRVLVDAPCTGFGVIRRKPEIKWDKTRADAERLASIQRAILEAAAPLVKPGGWLVYSTCTINRDENDRQLNRFLQEHPEFSWESTLFSRFPEKIGRSRVSPETAMLQLFPFQFETDGFFIGCLEKKEQRM